MDYLEEKNIINFLTGKHDANSERIKRFLAMLDLSRMPSSPLYELAQRIINIPEFKIFDIIIDFDFALGIISQFSQVVDFNIVT